MAKTLPQLVKIDRADPDRVEAHVEPYAFQKAARSPSPQPDPWDVPTVRLPRQTADALARRKVR